jgi:hypothetical protein
MRLLLSLCLTSCLALAAGQGSDSTAEFDAWWQAFASGRLPGEGGQSSGQTAEMRRLFAALAAREDGAGVERLLAAASLSLESDPGKGGRDLSRRPWIVVSAAERALASVRSPAAIQELASLLELVDRGRRDPRAPAALRALGATRSAAHRPLLARFLEARDGRLRRCAAEGLQALGSAAAVSALAFALPREKDENARIARTDAMRALLVEQQPPDQRLARAAVASACAALSRGTWRGDLAIVQFLRIVRSPESIPHLIDALERTRDSAAWSRKDVASGTLQSSIHATLVDLTGFYAPLGSIDAWRTFWTGARDHFQLPPSAEQRSATAAAQEGGARRTRAAAFFGIPVTGSRIVFVLDTSRSMTFPFGTSAEGGGGATTRFAAALRELRAAVQDLPPATRFNLISFADGARQWKKDLVPATAAMKQQFLAHLDHLQPDGGTNLYAALELALGIQSARPGDRYASNVDEVMVLSDGAPSVGPVIHTGELLDLITGTNRLSRVTIHTIFLGTRIPHGADIVQGPHTPHRLMELLAAQNHGQFVAR